MKKIISIIALAALLWNCTGGGARNDVTTGDIYGVVTDISTGEPINAAVLLLIPNGGTKITGSDGMYEFQNLQSGNYELKVFKEGFLSFNQRINNSNGDKQIVASLMKEVGDLSINKAYIDMGSNESNNIAGFSIINRGNSNLTWSIANETPWITKVDPASGTVPANNSTAVVISVDRRKLSSNITDNHATLVLRSTTAGDGSTAELLVTVFGKGEGTNTTIDNGEEYITLGDISIQTQNIANEIDWTSANRLCNNSVVGNYDDWRLPTIDELATFYQHKDVLGLKVGWWRLYWSSSVQESPFGNSYFVLNSATGEQYNMANDQKNAGRCVRTLP
jgi:hypothetical protein